MLALKLFIYIEYGVIGVEMERTWDGLPISREKPHGAAVVVFRRVGGRCFYLVLHRQHHGPDYAGDWAWGPPSGARLPDEPVTECARRELREETGLELPVTELDHGDGEWALFYAEASPEATVALSPEHDRYEWLPAVAAVARCLPAVVGEQVRAVAARIEAVPESQGDRKA